MFSLSEQLGFIIQVLCFYEFANSFYKVRAELHMALRGCLYGEKTSRQSEDLS